MPMRALRNFIRWESSAGLILMSAAILSLLIANSSLATLHAEFFATRTAIILGEFAIDKPLLLWINDGLMAICFLLIGLELKRCRKLVFRQADRGFPAGLARDQKRPGTHARGRELDDVVRCGSGDRYRFYDELFYRHSRLRVRRPGLCHDDENWRADRFRAVDGLGAYRAVFRDQKPCTINA